MTLQPIRTYVENGVTINVYPEKPEKHVKWQRNDTLYSRLASTEVAVSAYRKPGRA